MAWKEIQTKELNNGRLAMIAIAAFTAQELVSNQEIFEHLALRFEKEAILELDDIERDVGIKNVSVVCVCVCEFVFWGGVQYSVCREGVLLCCRRVFLLHPLPTASRGSCKVEHINWDCIADQQKHEQPSSSYSL